MPKLTGWSCRWSLAALVVASSAASARADRRVLVVGGDGSADVAAATTAAIDAKFTTVGLGDSQATLDAAAASEAKSQRVAAAALALGLENARAHYLEQEFGKMVEELGALRDKTLVFTAEPEQRQTLWELCFQRGLAYHASGDAARARREMTLAATVDPARQPPRDVYGPDLNQAFTGAVAAARGSVAKPFHIKTDPVDARVIIDGVPVVAGAGARTLRPGLHVVLARAPGMVPSAQIVDTTRKSSITIELESLEVSSPAEALGAAWARGASRPGAATINGLWWDVARALDADIVAWIGAGSPVDVVVLDAAGNTAVESAATAALATRAALARIGADGLIGSVGSSGDIAGSVTKGGGTSNTTRWLIIGGVTVAAVAVVVTGLALASGGGGGNGAADRIEVGVVP